MGSQHDSSDHYARSFGSATLLPSLSSPPSRSQPLARSSLGPGDSSRTPGSQRSDSQRTSPQSTTPSSSKATHVCDQCSRAFSRAEHLERHQTTHLPSTATKSFVCTACGKGFTRKDVLTRHIRAVHGTKKSDVRKSRRKSCRRCAAFKIKCAGGGKGKESGERAEEPCEACRKREVECIFDFGVTVDKTDAQDQANTDELFDFGSDDAHSEPDTGSSEYSVKRRKTTHQNSASGTPNPGAPMFLTSASASAVSPHLLSAARLASSQTQTGRHSDLLTQYGGGGPGSHQQSLELSSADELISMATISNKGMQIPTADRSYLDPPKDTSRSISLGPGVLSSSGFGSDFMSHLYFPPIRDPRSQILQPKPSDGGSALNRIAEEDLNAANTLQGINPAPPSTGSLHMSFPGLSESWKNNIVDESTVQTGVTIKPIDMAGLIPRNFGPDYSHTPSTSSFPRSPIFGGLSLPPPLPQTTTATGQNLEQSSTAGIETESVGSDDPGGLELHNEENFYFDFGIFDNSTDWLRDWGPNESISPESQVSVEAMETLPDSAFGVATTPCNYHAGGEAPGLAPVTNNVREQPKVQPIPVPSEDPAGFTPRPPQFGEDGGINFPGLPSVSPMKDHATSTDFLPWGWQHGLRDEPSRKVTLPSLRQVLPEHSGETHSRYGGHQSISNDPPVFDEAGTIAEKMRREMIHVLALPSARPPYPGCEASEIEKGFPNTEVIATFVKLYFEQFHPILPVVHRPTFCIERCPSILLIAMVSIGASYSNLKNAKAFADSLSELCKRCLAWMAENNPAYARSAFYLQSMCLQNLYAMGSGSTSLYDAADVSRSIIIGNARRIGLFSGVTNTPTSSSPSSEPGSPNIRPANGGYTPNHDRGHENPSVEIRWREWREKEALKRLAWGIFEYDSSFSTLSNRRGAITISDITIRIPCSESLWEASTATSWNILLAQEPEIRGLPFYRTLKDIISGRFDTKTLTSWGKRLCAQAMGRIMWDFKELEESVLSVAAVGNASFKPQKEMLLRCLMRVCDSSRPRAGEAEGDRYHWILARLIAHYTHLHAAFPTISLMLNLARKPPPKDAEANDPRIKRLKNTFTSDPVGARTLAWHAAQIIALSRWKPVFSPVEGMRLFLAGVVLWGFGNYHRTRECSPSATSSSSSSASGTYLGRQEDVVRLDLLPWNMPHGRGSTSPEDWIRYGKGKATIGIGGEASGDKMMEVCGEDGAKEVLRVVVGILGSLKVWGLGGEFKRVLEELMARKS